MLGRAESDDLTLATGIRRALATHLEFEVTVGPPVRSSQLTLWRAEYGTKNFSSFTRPKNTYAVIAICADAATCLDVAAMVRSVVPRSAPALVCGQPPAVSGGLVPL